MIEFSIGLVIGLVVGDFIGMMTIALCVASSEDDKRRDKDDSFRDK